MPLYFMILDLPFPRDDFVVSASRNALFIILFIFISENQTTFDVILPRCTYYVNIKVTIQMFFKHIYEVL